MVSWVLYCLARQKQRHDSQRAASEAVAHEEDLLYFAFSTWVRVRLNQAMLLADEALQQAQASSRDKDASVALAVEAQSAAETRVAAAERRCQAPLRLCSVEAMVEPSVLVSFLKWRASTEAALRVGLKSRVSVLIQTIANLSTEAVASGWSDPQLLTPRKPEATPRGPPALSSLAAPPPMPLEPSPREQDASEASSAQHEHAEPPASVTTAAALPPLPSPRIARHSYV